MQRRSLLPPETVYSQLCPLAPRNRVSTPLPAAEEDRAAVAAPAEGMAVEAEEVEEVLPMTETHLYLHHKAPHQEGHHPLLATTDPPTTLPAEVVAAEVAAAAVAMTTRANTRSHRPTAGRIPVQTIAITAADAAAAIAVPRRG